MAGAKWWGGDQWSASKLRDLGGGVDYPSAVRVEANAGEPWHDRQGPSGHRCLRRPVPLLSALGLFIVCGLVIAGCSASRHGRAGTSGGEETVGTPPSGGQIVEGSTLDRYKKGLPPEEGGTLKDVHFTYDSYELSEEARDILAANAQWLKDNPAVAVEIEGHCDERGTLEYNLALGAKRARAVKDYLASAGISAERLSTISYGKELPLCRDHTESCWARNRRAHFVLISN